MSTISLPTSYQDMIHKSRYARWRPELGRRETWNETVDRYIDFMCDKVCNGKIPDATKEEIRSAILELKVMPSMRCMMTAGPALEASEVAGYNCAAIAVSDVAAFDEAMYLLMCGCGVGFSVERQFIANLPVVQKLRKSKTTIKVEDSRMGWANAFRELLSMLYQGRIPEWDMSEVRPKGAKLLTFGGRASGPAPLVDLFNFCVNTFKNAEGRKLNSVECHDIMCKVGEVVVSGGVRRCLPRGSQVFTPNGPVAIENIKVGDTIVTGGSHGTVTAAGSSGVKRTIVIKHRFGEIECTPDHRVAVFNSIMKYEFKAAKDIVVGDRLVWDSVGYDGGTTHMPKLESSAHFNASSTLSPDIDCDIAWLIGLIHGDGYVSKNGLEIAGNMKELSTLQNQDF